MSDSDFGTLTDKDFEVFCCDLLGVALGYRFERFKPGRDQGVDGRFFVAGTLEAVLQCKHWPRATTKDLLRHIVAKEAPKLHLLKPARYILAVSTPLSRRDKEHLRDALTPYVTSSSDIFGREDLNDLLRATPLVERRHYKLWLTSAAALSHVFTRGTLERSAFTLRELVVDAGRYARTENHDKARALAETQRVVIIAGEPGIGKTTLAGQLALEYTVDGFDFILVSESLDDADTLFEKEGKQVFLFDDFLGRNYLEALTGHEGGRIVHFIRRIRKDPQKRFILTSRSTIWNRGRFLIDLFDVEHLAKNELVLTINDLRDIDKARILYNHLWHSSLPPEYREEIYKSRRYREIISHQNFNPRLIEFVTDYERLQDVPPDKYWDHLSNLLDNPADVWENPFAVQQNDFGRSLVILVTIHGRDIPETHLATAFHRYGASTGAGNGADFFGLLRQLTGSLLSRELRPTGPAAINLFNPSLGDYVLRRYSSDSAILQSAVLALRSSQALHTLKSLESNDLLQKNSRITILRGVLRALAAENFHDCDSAFLGRLCATILAQPAPAAPSLDDIRSALLFMLTQSLPSDVTPLTDICRFAAKRTWLSDDEILTFIAEALAEAPRDDGELRSLTKLFDTIVTPSAKATSVSQALQTSVVEMMCDSLSETVSDHDVLSGVDFEDYFHAESLVEDHIRDRLEPFSSLGFSKSVVDEIASSYDARGALDSRFEDAADDGERRYVGGAQASGSDDIDDLFDRT
jgi:hypothetical protein